MSKMPSDGDKIGASCNVCGEGYTYVMGEEDREHYMDVCEDCSEYFAELDDRRITKLRGNLDDELLTHIVESVNELDEYAAIPTPNQGHHGKAGNYWIIDATGGLEGISFPIKCE